MDLVRALIDLGGAARRNEILGQGVRLDALMEACRQGLVLRPHRGTYSLPGTPGAIVVAASLRGAVGCVSACDWWGLRSIAPPDVPHVVVPVNRHVQDERLKRVGVLGVHRDGEVRGRRLISPVDVAIDHASWCTTPLAHLVILDSALKSRRLDPLGPLPLTKGSAERNSWLARHANRFSQSVPETVARALLAAAGLNPVPQVAHDRVGHVDLGLGAKHAVEVDGWDTHGTKDAFAEDRRRDREMSAARKWTLRYTYGDVMGDMAEFVHDVARVMGRTVDTRFARRLVWMTTLPAEHLNRRGN